MFFGSSLSEIRVTSCWSSKNRLRQRSLPYIFLNYQTKMFLPQKEHCFMIKNRNRNYRQNKKSGSDRELKVVVKNFIRYIKSSII